MEGGKGWVSCSRHVAQRNKGEKLGGGKGRLCGIKLLYEKEFNNLKVNCMLHLLVATESFIEDLT